MDRKEQDAFDIEGLQWVVKQSSNEIIDLKNNLGEGTSERGFFIFPDMKHFPPRQFLSCSQRQPFRKKLSHVH